MVGSKKVVALAAALAMLAAPLCGAAAQARPHHRDYAYRYGYRPVPLGYWNYGPGFIAGIDWYGSTWRDRDNARGWDNSCINVPWLPSEFACSAR